MTGPAAAAGSAGIPPDSRKNTAGSAAASHPGVPLHLANRITHARHQSPQIRALLFDVNKPQPEPTPIPTSTSTSSSACCDALTG